MTTLQILSAGAVKGLVANVQAAFKAETGAEIEGSFSAVGAIQDRFLAGESCDVLILSQKMLDGLQARDNLIAGPIAPLGIVRTGIAVRAGQAIPDISSASAFGDAMKTSDAIYIPIPNSRPRGFSL